MKNEINIISNENIELLAQKGWKPVSTSYLKKWKKEELIEHIRILEHNWAGEIWGSNLIRKRLENACNYIKEQDVPLEKINKIISVEGENL